jgi:hypothetical protein
MTSQGSAHGRFNAPFIVAISLPPKRQRERWADLHLQTRYCCASSWPRPIRPAMNERSCAGFSGSLTSGCRHSRRSRLRRRRFHDVETFTGTVNGVPGTVTFNLDGSNDASLAVRATATIIDATGDLAGLHGVLHEVQTVVFPVGPVGTYSGQIG